MQENSEKINVFGKMKTLEVGETFELEKSEYKVSSVRVMANTIKNDSDSWISVMLKGDKIKVERVK